MTDDELSYALLQHPDTAPIARRLREHPTSWTVEAAPAHATSDHSDALLHSITRGYFKLPTVDGTPLTSPATTELQQAALSSLHYQNGATTVAEPASFASGRCGTQPNPRRPQAGFAVRYLKRNSDPARCGYLRCSVRESAARCPNIPAVTARYDSVMIDSSTSRSILARSLR